MTLPVSIGYPDWNRQVSEAQVVEVNDNPGSGTGVFAYPIRPMTATKALQVYAQPLSGAARFDFRFYPDSGGSFIGAHFQADCQLNDQALQAVPILGPYMDVQVTPAAAGPQSWTLMVWHTPYLAAQSLNVAQYKGINQDGVNVGAGLTVKLRSSLVFASEISWRIRTLASSYSVDVNVVDYLGTTLPVGHVDNGDGIAPPQQHTFAPAATLEVALSNFDAVANTFDVRLARRPYWAG
jgi:hypothetical protein